LKFQKLTASTSASGIRKNSTNTTAKGAACHQAGAVVALAAGRAAPSA
jgi:hypothetical protein